MAASYPKRKFNLVQNRFAGAPTNATARGMDIDASVLYGNNRAADFDYNSVINMNSTARAAQEMFADDLATGAMTTGLKGVFEWNKLQDQIDEAKKQAKRGARKSIFGNIGKVGGTLLGAAVGGPMGAFVGSKLGSTVGSSLG
jgi:hypothetical protein